MVVLPLVPVIAMMGSSMKADGELDFPDYPRAVPARLLEEGMIGGDPRAYDDKLVVEESSLSWPPNRPV